MRFIKSDSLYCRRQAFLMVSTTKLMRSSAPASQMLRSANLASPDLCILSKNRSKPISLRPKFALRSKLNSLRQDPYCCARQSYFAPIDLASPSFTKMGNFAKLTQKISHRSACIATLCFTQKILFLVRQKYTALSQPLSFSF